MKVIAEERRIVIRNGASRVYIEPWGENSVRVRMTAEAQMDDHDWALCEKVKEITPVITQTTVDMIRGIVERNGRSTTIPEPNIPW